MPIFQGRLASLNNATPMDIRRQQSALRVLKYYGLDNLIEDDRVLFRSSSALLFTYSVVYIALNLPPITQDPTERYGRKPCGLCLVRCYMMIVLLRFAPYFVFCVHSQDDPSICLCVACGCGRCFGKHYAEDALLCDSVINNVTRSHHHHSLHPIFGTYIYTYKRAKQQQDVIINYCSSPVIVDNETVFY